MLPSDQILRITVSNGYLIRYQESSLAIHVLIVAELILHASLRIEIGFKHTDW